MTHGVRVDTVFQHQLADSVVWFILELVLRARSFPSLTLLQFINHVGGLVETAAVQRLTLLFNVIRFSIDLDVLRELHFRIVFFAAKSCHVPFQCPYYWPSSRLL